MIWFGNLERAFSGPLPTWLPQTAEHRRMQFALERVAEHSPGLSGRPLIDALEATGWVDRATAERLIPHFRHFDPDRHFAEYLRSLSFRGRVAEDEFRRGIGQVFQEIAGSGRLGRIGPDRCVRFSEGQHEGIVLAHPEVAFTIGGRTREALVAAAEEMPDSLVLVARSFERSAPDQVASLLGRTDVRATFVTVNLLLGIRATALRYQPEVTRVLDLLSKGGTLRSADIARLGERRPTSLIVT